MAKACGEIRHVCQYRRLREKRPPFMTNTHPETKPEPVRAAWEPVHSNPEPVQRVIVTGIDVPFISLVALLVKLAIAAVPAAIIVSVIWMVVAAVLFGRFM